jgi:diacylglycerol kinase
MILSWLPLRIKSYYQEKMYREKSKYYLGARIKSFGYAIKGLKTFFQTQPHGRIHLLAALLVTIAGFYFSLSKKEWCLIIVACALVFVTEMLNTSIEFLTDIVSPEFNEKAGKVKDMAAAAVLVASIASVIIAAFIFGPKIF